MDIKTSLKALTALAQESRLAVFRLLVRAGKDGMPAGEIARSLGVPQNTMSAHLSILANADLVMSRKVGRSAIYSVDLKTTHGLLSYLLEDCCRGRPEVCAPILASIFSEGDNLDLRPADITAATEVVSSDVRITHTPDAAFNVLFLCTGNSARSIMAEAIINRIGAGKFRGFSAGSHPKGIVNPYALDLLNRLGYATSNVRSKSWDEFSGSDAPPIDFVFTLCDAASREVCPAWPGQPITAHWGISIPDSANNSEAERHIAFAEVFRMISNRISVFTSLPLHAMDRFSLQRRLDDIGVPYSAMSRHVPSTEFNAS